MLTAALLLALAVLLWPTRGRRETPAEWSHEVGPGPTLLARVRARLRAPRTRSSPSWVADFAEVVAIGLRAGLDLPSAALASASSPGVVAAAPWLGRRLRLGILRGQGVSTLLDLDLDPGVGPGSLAGGAPADEVAVAEAGDADAGAPSGAFVRGPLGDPVRRPLGALERRDLAHLVAAWRLAEEVGAAAAAVTASAASSVRERQVAQERTAVVMAGPRASMLLLSALPLAGPLAALVAGVPPGRLYDSAPSRLLAAGGLALTALGWWWARRLLTRAGRPARTDAEPR